MLYVLYADKAQFKGFIVGPLETPILPNTTSLDHFDPPPYINPLNLRMYYIYSQYVWEGMGYV